LEAAARVPKPTEMPGDRIVPAYISLEKALLLFGSTNPDEFTLGMNVLFQGYVNRKEVWNAFVKYVVDHPASEIPPALIYYLAHIPWHPDIAWMGDEQITVETRDYAKQLLSRFGKTEVIKLLSCIDEESGIERGSIGQCVAAIILSLPGAKPILASICHDRSLPVFTRECAGIIIGERARRVESLISNWYVQVRRMLRRS
jgi:hypothetical protein